MTTAAYEHERRETAAACEANVATCAASNAANGMPELHKLTPYLGILQDRGFRVALVTDGRMSGASGKVCAAIHVTPEAAKGGLLGRLRDGDLLRVDAITGVLSCLGDLVEIEGRPTASMPRSARGCVPSKATSSRSPLSQQTRQPRRRPRHTARRAGRSGNTSCRRPASSSAASGSCRRRSACSLRNCCARSR